MKKLILTPIFALLLAGSSMLTAQNWSEEYLGLPGDNLNLFAVMNLFQESETLEGFERSLNDPETMINNLDLVGDGYVDYIMVFDYQEGDVHNIVLRVALNQYEYQDVAVFVVRKLRSGAVQIQLIGDEALYGPNYIIEPNYAETPNPGYRGTVTRPRNVNVVTTTYYEVATWPVIVYIHRPYYRVWRSPWRWGYHPVWWHPWTPHYWHFYFGYHYHWHAHYFTYYRPWRYHRCGFYRNYYYTGIRRHSTTVVVNINNGRFRDTYSRPDKRSQGEELFTQRHSSGRTVPERNASVDRGGRQGVQPNANVGARTSGAENQRRVAAPANSRTVRDNNAVRQNTGAGQNARVTNSSENRRPAVQNSNTQRRQTTTAPARTESRQPASRVNEPQRRQSAPASNRNVSRSTPERNTSAPRNAPSSVSPGRSSSQPSSVGRSEPARAPRQSAPSVRSSGSNNRSGSSGTSVQSSGSNNRSGSSGTSVRRSGSSDNRSTTAPQRSQSSGQSRSSRPSGR